MNILKQAASRTDRMHKAKDVITNQWISGWYIEIRSSESVEDGGIRCCIARCEMKHPDKPDVCQLYEILNNTLCRCSGFTDADGKLVWEHDIVQRERSGHYGVIMYGEHEGGDGFYILWNDDWLRKDLGYWHAKITVTSNVFDAADALW
ncbi:MAG: hypothetical protein LUE14_04350 [Clostridiales bacterium]|nr:hypothetical protein [Clostridiales bacterium]